ncbi:MAG: peptide deformylase [Patescibacteria group bacterium]
MRTQERVIVPEDKNPVLRQKADDIPVADIRAKPIQKLISEMRALLAKEEYGVAVAAPQVGEPLRLFVISGRALARGGRNAPDEPNDDLEAGSSKLEAIPDQVYINPELLKISRAKSPKHEGCLSIRGKWGTVPRAEKATVRAYDEHGTLFTRGASGFLAHIFQHELDHLEGILYTDKATHVYDEKEEEK